MRAAQPVALASALLALTLVAAVPIAGGQSTATASPRQNDTALPTRVELFDSIGENASEHAAALYYVSEDGEWLHASPNGSTGTPAPKGSDIPRLAGEEFSVPPGDRPEYLWKVVSENECSTAFYDATNTSDATTYAVPGCPPRTPPSGASPTESALQTETPPPETRAGPQPGFGLVVAAIAVIGAGWLAARR